VPGMYLLTWTNDEARELTNLASRTRCMDPALSGSDGLMHTGGHDSDRAEVG
jgi:hypothetical protein